MQPTYPTGLASSQDSSQLSLTVSSASQLILWMVATFAVHKGMDPMAATNAAQAYIDVAVNALPAGFVVYHAVMTFWGLTRKGFAYFRKQPGFQAAPTPTAPAQN